MNTATPFFSICIPAYKNAAYLGRLLDSIALQTFRDFEVIISDDSPDDALLQLIEPYKAKFPIFYQKNIIALGTPENWNQSIRQANGKWIKLMHDDDWFSGETSLQLFADAAISNPSKDFIFSAYNNVYLGKNKTETISAPSNRLQQLKATPMILVAKTLSVRQALPSSGMIKNFGMTGP